MQSTKQMFLKPSRNGLGSFFSIAILVIFVFSMIGCSSKSGQSTEGQAFESSQALTTTHSLQISRYTTSSLSNSRADQILTRIGTILQVKDGANDVACDVSFTRSGSVSTFSTGNGKINSRADFLAVNDLPGNVKIVNQINWCGALKPNVIGCAPVPGSSFVAVRHTSNQEGVLWVHEFGHNKGLSHINRQFAIMRPTASAANTHVNAGECGSYQAQALTSLAASVVEQYSASLSQADNQADGQTMDIKEFVRQTFFHGVPYEDAIKYGEDDIETLSAMLDDPAEEPYWSNIAVTMCMIGNEPAVNAVISFIDEDLSDTLSQAHYTAKTSAIMALGYAVNRNRSARALDYLTRNSQGTESWEVKNWSSPFQTSTSERNLELSTMAILGLALSGTAEAADALRSLTGTIGSFFTFEFREQMTSTISEALTTNLKISEIGLIEYYKDR